MKINYYLMWIRSPFKNAHEKFSVGSIYFTGENGKASFLDAFKRMGRPNAAQFFSVRDFFKKYDHSETGNHINLVIRSGGIGDLIALSSVVSEIPGKVVFWTEKKYLDIFEFYSKKVEPKDYSKPVFENVNMAKLMQIQKSYRLLDFDDTIENGSDQNWYDVFHQETGITGQRRPELKNLYPEPSEDYLLVCHKSTSNMRSARLSDLVEAIYETPEMNEYRPIKVHEVNLSREDYDYLEGKEIEIIPKGTLNDFLDDIYYAGMVVTVDSAAIHFREGLKLPAIGIYNAFTAKSRTDGYEFTYSFDIVSRCPNQPCFLHQFHEGKRLDHCPMDLEKKNYAPCFAELSPDLKEQLKEGFKTAIENFENIGYLIHQKLA
jgi:ADP-heptose:LPS heptosyltransferase